MNLWESLKDKKYFRTYFLGDAKMNLRENLKDKKYFRTYFKEENRSLVKFSKKLSNNEIREDRILPVKEFMYLIKYHMMIAKYSAGYPLEEVKKDYMDVLKDLPLYLKDDPELSQRINMVSMGILFEIEDEHFDMLARFIEETGEKEYMFDYLIHYRKPKWDVSDKVRFESVFGWIKKATQMSKSDAEAFLAEYLKSKWYSTHEDFYWYDNHKSKVNGYFGYWCFEAGAIVKIMGLDDSALKGNRYYPYDLVHYSKA